MKILQAYFAEENGDCWLVIRTENAGEETVKNKIPLGLDFYVNVDDKNQDTILPR